MVVKGDIDGWQLFKKLIEIGGKENFLTETADRITYSYDVPGKNA